MKNLLATIVVAITIVIIATILPCLLIWSLNTLFKLNIEYEVQNIFAAFILLCLINSNTTTKK